jgi:DNA-binding PadR family transcriptional regulator
MRGGRDPEDFLPLRGVELDILLGVVDRARHGYAILQEADARTGGRARFEIPTLYRALRRMRDDGLIRTTGAPAGEDDDPRREYWVVTTLGRQVLEAELERMEMVLSAGRARLSPRKA